MRCGASARLRWLLAVGGLCFGLLGLVAPAHAAATIYFRSVSTAATASGSTLSISAPANLAVGDLMILDVDASGTTTFNPPTTPGTWTSIFNGNTYGGDSIIEYRVATAADVGATYSISLGATRAAEGRIVAYTGVSTTGSVETDAITGNTAAGTLTYSSVTTTAANSMVVLLAGAAPATGTPTISTPAGTTVRASVSSGSSPAIVGNNYDFVQATAGATPTKTSTVTPNSAWGTAAIALKPATTGTLQFAVAPGALALPTLTLNGQAQTLTAAMPSFAVDDTTGSGSGWHVTVNGATGTGVSPVFAEYCPVATCGSHTGVGYVTGGFTLPASSLTLNTTGASWTTTGGSGSAPTGSCASGCAMDTSSATSIASAASGAGLGPWQFSGFGASSLSLAAPTTVRSLQANEVYHLDLVFTLVSGP